MAALSSYATGETSEESRSLSCVAPKPHIAARLKTHFALHILP